MAAAAAAAVTCALRNPVSSRVSDVRERFPFVIEVRRIEGWEIFAAPRDGKCEMPLHARQLRVRKGLRFLLLSREMVFSGCVCVR